jgi:hypothetical protein
MMLLTLTRNLFTDQSTEGKLTFDSDPTEMFTLELPNKDGLPGSCIPAGNYPVVLAPSPKFLGSTDPWILRYASLMPHIIQIPERTLIMMHFGNDAHDTDGCVLVGFQEKQDFIGSSRVAFAKLWDLIETPARSNSCRIQVIGGAIWKPTPADLSMQGDV